MKNAQSQFPWAQCGNTRSDQQSKIQRYSVGLIFMSEKKTKKQKILFENLELSNVWHRRIDYQSIWKRLINWTNHYNCSLLQRAEGEIRGVDGGGWRYEGDWASQHRPEGGRGNGTVAEDWRHQRKRLSFRAWNKDLSQTIPALFHFSPSTLDTSLLTLNCCLWSTIWSFLHQTTNRGITAGGSN